MSKKLGIIFLLTIYFFQTMYLPLSSQAAAQSLETDAIDDYITNYIELNGLPATSIVVVKDGELVYVNGFSHVSNGEPLTEKSFMSIASVSNSFTSFVVLQLVDEGEIKLYDPVVNDISELTIEDTRWDQLSIRQLLSHTSG